MEARAYPRTKLSLPVGLYCPKKDFYYHRKISDISVGGLFVSGRPCGPAGMAFDVIVNPAHTPVDQCQRFSAQVVRSTLDGFALKFSHLGQSERHSLEDVIWPKWDGENMYEGLLLIAAREDVKDLAGWLHLTSIVCNQYRRLCSKPRKPQLG